jgi:hypothetical protein
VRARKKRPTPFIDGEGLQGQAWDAKGDPATGRRMQRDGRRATQTGLGAGAVTPQVFNYRH